MSDRFGRTRALALYAALSLGGAAALAYQTAWARMLHRVFGVGDFAVATVLAAFFLGMGLGSALGAKLATRVRRPARAYAVLEAGIGVWAALSLLLIPLIQGAYTSLGAELGAAPLTALRLSLAMAVLLPPTLLMGATLPVAVGAILRDGSRWSLSATRLYTVNTLGAVMGAGLTGLYALPLFGARSAVLAAAVVSFVAAALALVGLGGLAGSPAASAPVSSSRTPAPRMAMALAAAAGFAALASEVLWTRVLRVIVQGTSQAFAAMLVCYLLGITLGSLLAQRLSGGGHPLAKLGVSQLAAATLTLAGIALSPQLVRVLVLLHGEATVVPHEPWVLLTVSALLLLPLGIALGTSVPLLFECAGGDRGSAGAMAGRILAANTLGGLVGALVAGFVLVPLPRVGGLENSLYLVAFLHVGIGLVALVRWSPRAPLARVGVLAAPLAVVCFALLARPSLSLPFLLDAWYDPASAAIRGPDDLASPPFFLEEGRSTTVTVLRRDAHFRLFNDGRPESGLSPDAPGFGPELVLLGGLPSLFAETPRRAMMVGLGGGHSTAVLLAGPFERVDVVELEGAVVDAAREMYRLRNLESSTPLPFPVDDPRAHVTIDDARAQLSFAAPASYDAIVSQPSHPWLAGAGALYTEEFFLEARRALRPGGVLCQWINIFRMDVEALRAVLGTLTRVFPHALAFMAEDSSLVVVAGLEPLWEADRIDERLDDSPRLRDLFAAYRLAGEDALLSTLELDAEAIATLTAGATRLVDDRPWLEARLSRIPHDQALTQGDLDLAFSGLPWLGETSREQLGALTVSAVDLRIERLHDRPAGVARVALTAAEISDEGGRRFGQGRVADALGDIDGALAGYDASADPEAAFLADRLRLAEGRLEELVTVAGSRASRPTDVTPWLEAALALGDRDAARLAATAAADAFASIRVLDAARRFAETGCQGLLDVVAERDATLHSRFLLEGAADCAREAGDEARAEALDARIDFALRGVAREARTHAERAAVGGNEGAAIVAYRRSLRAQPGDAATSRQLMELLSQRGDKAGAQRVLDEALFVAPFVDEATIGALRHAGAQLDLSIAHTRPAVPPTGAALPNSGAGPRAVLDPAR